MTALTVLTIIVLLWVLRELILMLYAKKRISNLNRVIRIERSQTAFAEARFALMRLVVDDKIDPHSKTFGFLYFINTLFMRRPDKYMEMKEAIKGKPGMGEYLRQELNSTMESEQKYLPAERTQWTNEVRDVMKRTADAMDNVLWDYSLRWRIFVYLAQHPGVRKTVEWILRGLSDNIVASQEKKDPVVRQIRLAQKAMYRLAML